ncbi:hypothetical protein [Deinococcus multiflagellatus]|uniref:Uncharacterized protein n=1 Tax=Deinococcus multiflagellatus TaxID=1656887 RepID=A0ABW1ZIR2_9DEIO|nr:hypothetical protein [Deinococcus multiflagellatus]MBZ9713791.1 hypothetical protein [Deinococcus multiflagellatus]
MSPLTLALIVVPGALVGCVFCDGQRLSPRMFAAVVVVAAAVGTSYGTLLTLAPDARPDMPGALKVLLALLGVLAVVLLLTLFNLLTKKAVPNEAQ